MKTTVRVVVVLTGLLIFAILALKWALSDPERFREPLSEQLRSATGYSVSFQTLDWQVWPQFALEVSDLRIPADPDSEPLLKIENLGVEIELIPLLLEGALTIDALMISTLTLNLVDFEDGRTNYDPLETQDDSAQVDANAAKSSAQKLPNLSSLKIDTLHIRYEDIAIKQVIDLQADDLTGALSDGVLTMTFSDLLKYSDSDLDLDFEGQSTGTLTLLPETLILQSENFKASGQLRGMDLSETVLGWSLSGQYDLERDIATIDALSVDFLGLESQITGQLKGLTAPRIDLDLALETALIKPHQLNTVLENLNLEGLNLDLFSLRSRVLGTDVAPRLIELSGTANQTVFEGDAALNQEDSEVMLNLQLDRLDFGSLVPDSEPSQPTATEALDPETLMIPRESLATWIIDVQLTAEEILWQDLNFEDAGLSLSNRNRTLTGDIVGKLNSAPLEINLKIDYSDKTFTTANAKLSDFDLSTVLPDYNLGRMSLKTSLDFTGTTLGDLTSNLKGPTVITLAEGLLDISALKQAAQIIDQISGTQSGAGDWPNQLAFDELLGNIALEQGLASKQQISFDYQNLSLRAEGGIDIYTDALDYALIMRIAASETTPLKASGPLTQIGWPARCQGAIDLPVMTLCQIDRSQSRALIEDLARSALKKKASHLLDKTLKEKAPEELKNLLRGLLGR